MFDNGQHVRLPVAILLAVVLSATSCVGGGSSGSSSSSSGSALVCAPGDQKSCACIGGAQGVQVCNTAGTGYDACLGCSPSSSGAATSTMGSSSANVLSSNGSSILGTSSGPGTSSGAAASSGAGASSGAQSSGASSAAAAGSSLAPSSGASGGCGRPATAIRGEEQLCNSDNQCLCGLGCSANQCLRNCDTPGMMGTCSAGKICVAGNTPNVNFCVRVVGRDGDCAVAVCQDGLECEFGSTDDQNNPTSAACHLPCNTDGTCASTDECLASTPGFVEIANAADGGIPCNPDAGGTCTGGNECLTLSGNRTVCAQPVRACGKPQKPYGFTPAGDGGTLPATQDELCNLGPAITDTGGTFPGSLFCDEYRELPTPPEVFCYNGIDETAPGFGYCVAICRYFANGDGTAAQLFDCPANYHCAVNDAVFYNPAQATPTSPNTTCTTDAQCSGFPGATCVALNAGTVCAYPYGLCRPGPAPSSSSSPGGTGSSVGSSSSGGSSTPVSSSAGGSSSSGGSASI